MSALYAHLKDGAFSRRDEDDPLEGIVEVIRDNKTIAKIVLVLENEKDPEKLRVHLMYGPTESLGFSAVEERTFTGAVAMAFLTLCGHALAATGDLAERSVSSGPQIRVIVGG